MWTRALALQGFGRRHRVNANKGTLTAAVVTLPCPPARLPACLPCVRVCAARMPAGALVPDAAGVTPLDGWLSGHLEGMAARADMRSAEADMLKAPIECVAPLGAYGPVCFWGVCVGKGVFSAGGERVGAKVCV